MADKEQSNLVWLREKGHLQEQSFTSTVPLFGPLIVWFRTMWNNVAAKWIIRRLIQQQNEFNGLIVQEISNIEDQIFEQLIEQDREQTALIREMGEINVQVRQINRVLEAIEERLTRLENRGGIEASFEEE